MRTLRITLALLLFCACSASKPDAAEAAPRHLILISIDTLRSDRLGCYGHERETSPTIDALAASGTLFVDASAPSPWTKPSHASIFTGLYPVRHGADAMRGDLSKDVTTLAERMQKAGFKTQAIVNATWLKMQGLERGFEKLEWVPYEQGDPTPSPVADAAIRAIKKIGDDERAFLFVHFMDVHSDYTSLPAVERRFVGEYVGSFDGSTQQLYRIAEGALQPNDDDVAHLLDLYDAGIRQVDDQLKRLIDALSKAGLREESLIVLTSDHGDEFLEHGGATHGHTQFEEVLRVPLIVTGGGSPTARVERPVSLVDIFSTVERAFDLAPTGGLDGEPLFTDTGRPRLQYGEADVTFPPPAPGLVPPGNRRSVRAGRYKLHVNLRTRQVDLFDLERDPQEQNDISSKLPETSQLLLNRLRLHLKGEAGSTTLSDDEVALLTKAP